MMITIHGFAAILSHPWFVVVEEHWAIQLKLKAYPMDARDEFIYKTDLVLRIKKACARQQIPSPRARYDPDL